MVRLHLYLLGGETDISLACFQRGLVCFWYRLALPCSETHHIITFSTLNRSSPSISIDYTSKRHTADQLSHAACSAEIFAENSAKKVFSFYSLNSESLNKWDDWYLALCCWKHFPILSQQCGTWHKPIDVYIQLPTHSRLWFGLH